MEQWDNTEIGELFYCSNLKAKLTKRGCIANQCAALRAWNALMEEIPYGIIEDKDIDRLVSCSSCPNAQLDEVDPAKVIASIRNEFDKVSTKLENMNWDMGDPDVSIERRKKQVAKYNLRDRDKRIKYMKLWRWKNSGMLPNDM